MVVDQKKTPRQTWEECMQSPRNQDSQLPRSDSYNTSKRAFTGVKDAGPFGPPLACVKVVRGQDGAVTGARARSAHDFCSFCSPT